MNQEAVRWEDFEKIHVIRKLKEIIGKWWQVQINFTDRKGFLRNVPDGRFFNPLNPICQAIVADDKGFSKRLATARQTTVDSMSSKTTRVTRDPSGFSVISVPIHVNNEFLGTVFGDGFVVADSAAEQKALIRSYLERDFPQRSDLLAEVENLPVLSEKELRYLTELITLVVDEILVMHKFLDDEKSRVSELSKELGVRYGFDRMIGKSLPMQELYRLLERICDSDATVLIQGSNGTGKELIAKALHYNSKRKSKKFLVVNCGAFNENLLESELFGHIKGSFTGAVKDKKGLFEAADGGTLFLDEIGDTSMQMQVKLLRVLQEGTFTPVGSTEVKKSSVRVLAATNKPLVEMVKSGEFREDLYYRLNVINVTVPMLKDRKEDIVLLADHFLEKFAKNSGTPKKKISKSCLEKLMDHDWPGNVRELENEVERLCVLAGDSLDLNDDFLSPRIKENANKKYPGLRVNGNLKDSLESLEKQMILDGLERTGWNKSRLAKELGISRAGLITKVNKYGLEKRGG
ncbi:sigma-54 interaction domain-containing protein [Pseudobacteriovorax antillogorgiicola]|uniref:DNA-binding transcriptional response regulator, NtrC family, contains REC, AAA-type ATPase, and a Fis-type DNA-binding domains n=1 Tax=Pseudobacteriovorax antillogorgiicola TaxID=1513793 RepID=A0A1Y6CQ60_9BACT|nr:sigma-54 dependent transcriptional regulator [Pseudobacteriovorax antillogorgiicola]TCS46171.1 DNA-binding NtrC family response regulator [Pseudobacteriovorax antillogorgiicola]SMF69973.1 DNA-binding transcriptional response regulator, NtrC family, contains REC, AAA-type ATPase, and a Fis-type DNA-binding domains [Pseudobacteriovorax antillogorgiicola]